MVAATDHDFPPDPARGPAVQSSSSKTRGPTPMHRDCKLKPDDQGICTSEDGQLWPVVVLRDDMVPDMLRPAEPPASEGKVPVLFFGSMDVEYVSRDTIQKQDPSYFFQAISDDFCIEANPALYSAMHIAAQENSAFVNLQKLRNHYGEVTTAWDKQFEQQAKEFQKKEAPESTTPKHHMDESDCEKGQVLLAQRARKRLRLAATSRTTSPDISDKNVADKSISDAEIEAHSAHSEQVTRLWCAEEDAELLRLRERIMPDASWTHIVDAFNQRFAYPPRSYSSITSRYINVLHPDAAAKGRALPSTCARMRARGLSYLSNRSHNRENRKRTDRRSYPLESDPKSRQQWTAEQDAEIIRLREQKGIQQAHKLGKCFQKKFPASRHSPKALRDRYNQYLQQDAYIKRGKAKDQEECDAIRAIALSLLDHRLVAPGLKVEPKLASNPGINANGTDSTIHLEGSSLIAVSHGQRWTGEEDACIVWMREDCAESSWMRVAEVFKKANRGTARTMSAMRSRYNDYLQRDAWIEGNSNTSTKAVCDNMRARALSLVAFLNISLDDDELTQSEISSQASNMIDVSERHKRKENHEFEANVPEHPDFEPNKKWTAEEDAHLIQLREEHMKDASWLQRYEAWTKAMPLSKRTKYALQSRYRYYLISGAAGKDKFNGKDCQELRDRALTFLLQVGENKAFATLQEDTVHGRAWSTKEDAMLTRLREDILQAPNWKRITHNMKRRIPGFSRTTQAVAKRYGVLMSTASSGDESGESSNELRQRAIASLSKMAPISDLSTATDSEEEVPRKHQVGQRWAATEDAELIRLIERVGYQLQWPAVLQAFRLKFSSSGRTIQSLKDRYNRTLVEGALGTAENSLGYCEKMRKRALVILDQTMRNESRKAQVTCAKARTNVISLLSDEEDEVANAQQHGYVSESDESESDDGDETESSQTVQPKSDINTDTDADDDEEDKLEMEDENALRHDSEDESDDEVEGDALTLLIGQNQEQFRVPLTRTLGNSYILEDAVESDTLGAIVTGARWTRVKPEQFRPVYEYLKRGDYRPRIRHGKLDGSSNTPGDYGREIVRCGQTFNLARDMKLEELMDLVCRKFDLLEKQPLGVLFAAKAVFKTEADGTELDAKMRKMLVQDAVDNFPAYQIQEAKEFWKLQDKAPEFVYDVIEQFAAKLKKERGERM